MNFAKSVNRSAIAANVEYCDRRSRWVAGWYVPQLYGRALWAREGTMVMRNRSIHIPISTLTDATTHPTIVLETH